MKVSKYAFLLLMVTVGLLYQRLFWLFLNIFCHIGDGDDYDYEEPPESDEDKKEIDDGNPLAYKLELQRHLADLLPGELVGRITLQNFASCYVLFTQHESISRLMAKNLSRQQIHCT